MIYQFAKYCNLDRWSSYWHQIKEIVETNPESVLEFGRGDGVVGNYIKHNTKTSYYSADIDPALNPDYLLSVADFKLDKKFDTVCAFEVLEHLPYDKFETCLKNLMSVSDKYVLISLPHWGRHFSLSFQLPFFGKKNFQFKLSGSRKHKYSGEHYWEIGTAGYPLKKIISDMEKVGLKVENHYICHQSPYHHFFKLKINGQ